VLFLTMWRTPGRECLLIMGDQGFRLRVIAAGSPIKEAKVRSADAAVALAEKWAIEDREPNEPDDPRLPASPSDL
jgi:hypothetical protein